jgi:DNA repair protein RadC
MRYAPIYRLSLISDGRLPYEDTLRQSSDVAKFVRPLFEGLDREMFVAVLLNAKHRPIGTHIVSIGSLTASVVHPRETFKCAVVSNAEAIFVAHNHPSGSPEPSPEDIEITERLRECGELLGIRLIDHVIIAEENHFSFVASGYWKHRRAKTTKSQCSAKRVRS